MQQPRQSGTRCRPADDVHGLLVDAGEGILHQLPGIQLRADLLRADSLRLHVQEPAWKLGRRSHCPSQAAVMQLQAALLQLSCSDSLVDKAEGPSAQQVQGAVRLLAHLQLQSLRPGAGHDCELHMGSGPIQLSHF